MRTRRAQLHEHGVEVQDAEVDHGLLVAATEVVGVLLERSENGGAGLLVPDRFWRHGVDPELLRVPACERLRVPGPLLPAPDG